MEYVVMRSKPWKMHHDFCAAPAYGANLQCDYIYFKPKEIARNGIILLAYYTQIKNFLAEILAK